MTDEIPVHPIQTNGIRQHTQTYIPQVVTMRAYEVYCHVFSPQEALITGQCRGGFAMNELISFLYAYPFPKNEWMDRINEAMNGSKNI